MNALKQITSITLVFILQMTNTMASEYFADSHIHYNWDHEEETPMSEVIDILRQHDVGLTIVASTPSPLALSLREKAGDWVIPFFSPYIHEAGKKDWYMDAEVVTRAEQGLKSGQYYGIGEVHFMNGLKPRTDNGIFRKLIALAEEYDVPMLIHIDSSNEQTFQRLCLTHPEVRMIFAHAGGNLRPEHIEKVLLSCDNAWIDFAARDPWRYDGLTNDEHTLLPAWKDLVLRFPERFITGTDPVWKVTRWSTWDTGDEGWQYYQRLYDYHWSWLNDLPEEVRRKVAWENTQDLLKK